ncbi:MAG: acyltransferase family protein [Acidimicrobiales bacterium]|nr:acyltransferase family protein [Acidimicrobiales bacterium]
MAPLDGLRAVAVTAVVLFHTGASWMSGGFLGVSTFFTLSGFLITTLLLAEHRRSDTVSLTGFWRRRVRRLLPISAVTLVVVVALAPVAWSALQLDRLTGDVAAAGFYVANWRFLLTDSSYLDLFAAPSPVLHYWSLAIEEQFYVVFPLVAVWSLRRGGVTLLARVIAAGVVVSAALPLVFSMSPDRVYLGTDTRAAELLIGALLATVVAGRGFGTLRDAERRSTRRLGAAGPVALAVSLVAFVVVDRADSWLYGGGLAAFGFVSLVVVASAVAPPQVSPVARLLAFAPLVAIGRISYGIYVIHWPLFQVLTEQRTGLDPVTLNAVRIGLTLVLAVLSARLLEQPIRRGRVVPRRLVLVAVPVCAVAIAVLAVVVVRPLVQPASQITFGVEGSPPPVPVAESSSPPLAASAAGTVPTEPVRTLVVGGPATAALATSIDGWAAMFAPDLTVATEVTPCGATRAPIGVAFRTEQETCAGWVEAWTAALAAEQPEIVVLLLPLEHTTMPAWGDRVWREEAQAVVDLLTSTGATVLPVDTTPNPLDGFDAEIPIVLDAQGANAGLVEDLPVGGEAAAIGERLRAVAGAVAAPGANDADVPRVMVVGDSLASNLGLALEQWAQRTGSATVWNAAALGCGIAEGGRTTATPPHDVDADKCLAWRDGWAAGVAQFQPDIVLFLPSAWDLPGREVPGWGGVKAIGDATFDAWLVEQYQGAVDTWGAGGATVVAAGLPCTGDVWTGFAISGTGAFDNDRIAALDRLVAERLDGVSYVDLPAAVCPGGAYVADLGGIEGARPDGLHFSADAALWVADRLGPQVLAARPADGGTADAPTP